MFCTVLFGRQRANGFGFLQLAVKNDIGEFLHFSSIFSAEEGCNWHNFLFAIS